MTRALGWLAAIGLIVLLARRVSLHALAAAVAAADLSLLGAAAVFAMAAEVTVSSVKYQRIVAALGTPLAWGETVVLRMGSFPVRNLLPLKSGEALRVTYLHRCHGMPYAAGAIAALLDALTHAAGLGAFALAGLALRAARGTFALGLAACALALGFSALAVAAYTGALWPRAVRWLLRRPAGDATLAVQRPSWAAARAIAMWSALTVAADLVSYGLVLRAFRVPVPLARMALFVPVIDLASALPVTPMGVGLRETAISVLLAPYGRPETLLTSALGASAVLKLVPTVAGFAFLRPLLTRLAGARPTGAAG